MTRLGFAVPAAFLAAMLASTGAPAQRLSKVNGSKLLSLCSSGRTENCDAYLSGVADAYAEVGRPGGICIPIPVTGVQLRLVVVKYMHDHPQELEQPGGVLTSHALTAAFPCK
jgi:hypothetical protein